MPEYDFYATVKADLDQLTKEMDAEDLSAGIDAVAKRLGVPRERALAALWRASKRHGETLSVFLSELKQQDEREAARKSA
jgi:NAD(P)-dependent dehydrogenase (short-subunit alcohol dehydrogenase family)